MLHMNEISFCDDERDKTTLGKYRTITDNVEWVDYIKRVYYIYTYFNTYDEAKQYLL